MSAPVWLIAVCFFSLVGLVGSAIVAANKARDNAAVLAVKVAGLQAQIATLERRIDELQTLSD